MRAPHAKRDADTLIAVLIPTRGIVFAEVMQGVVDNMAGRSWRLFTTIDEGLPDCMNILVRRALVAGADWLWIVEEDTVPPAGVLDAMLAMRKPYVACDYPVGHSHTCFGFDSDGLLWTGFGCTLIAASVFAGIPEPWFECNRNMVVQQRGGLDYFTADMRTVNNRGGHDLSFAEKLKVAGIDRHGLRGWECRHLKMHGWNVAPTNKACHDIRPVPPIVVPWQEYLSDEPRCSVVIPCYNHAAYLAEAIESALAQTVPVEVIVVDDGSTDGSHKVASRYPVQLIRQKNRGLAAARNVAIAAAQCSHILPLDADDVLEPECVERMLTASKTAIVRAPSMLFGDVPSRQWLPGGPTTLVGFLAHNAAAACSMFPRAVWEQVGGYDESMRHGYEDWDLWVRMVASGVPVATVPQICWRYRKHGPSLVTVAIAKAEGPMRAKWASLGIGIPAAPERVHGLVYPVRLAVGCTLDGRLFPAGSRVDRATALALKVAGQLTDPRIQ